MGNKPCSGIIKMLLLCLFSLLQSSNLVRLAPVLPAGHNSSVHLQQSALCGVSSAPSRKPLWYPEPGPEQLLKSCFVPCFLMFSEKHRIIQGPADPGIAPLVLPHPPVSISRITLTAAGCSQAQPSWPESSGEMQMQSQTKMCQKKGAFCAGNRVFLNNLSEQGLGGTLELAASSCSCLNVVEFLLWEW